ncbi:phosphoglycerate kinase [Thermoanaerobacterium thermosaccharolyticum]|uniref:phosphoglycerate kinase n=1 Tax=Thermoanaerobacterium thermosaccharolyticum TaxID=1517 RepID=UPI003DA7E9DA
MDAKIKMNSIEEFDYQGKTVLLRLDINSPIDPVTKKIVNENRINQSLPTLRYLIEQGAKIAIIAHQGDTLDYQNLIPMNEHAEILSKKLGREVKYIDDVCGPAAQDAIKNLKNGELVLLGNLRYLTEEVSTFENDVKLEPEEMLNTYLVRNIAPLVDAYVNDAFSAAHRNSPSMVAFQEILPSAAGLLMFKEISALTKVMENPIKPSVFVLGGLKISDAFGMMKTVLENGTADKILTCGVTGHIMLKARGYDIGKINDDFINNRSLDVFIKPAKEYLEKYGDKILMPVDLAYEKEGKRLEIPIEELPVNYMFMDIGHKTIEKFQEIINEAGTIFVNGPAGVYENKIFEDGTKAIWSSIADAKGYSVIGGGDTVSAAQRFIDTNKIDYVCTAGGAMVRFLSGKKLPLIKAMEKAYLKNQH